ncbi:MAG: putative selenium-dependent hydroxylase accessory protein YqeC [Clostridiales bacterium]|nr:putative selenium-dependent hydroxylase accessory protein YqeC [Candidatus Cacconaster stercorequi]
MKLAEMLKIQPGVTALIGGGGKTTLLYHLAEELRRQGTVLVCTTTKIWPPAQYSVAQDSDTLRKMLRDNGVACAGTPTEQGKLAEPNFPWANAADYVLVEADGAAGRPFKAHDIHEPVLPKERNNTILVLGADGFGKAISKMAHRPMLYARLAGVMESQSITPAIAAKVINREKFHDRIFINQVDREEEWPLVREFAEKVDCPVVAGALQNKYWESIK